MKRFVLIGAGVLGLILIVVGVTMCSLNNQEEENPELNWTTTYHTTTTTRYDPDGQGWTPGFY